MVEDIEYICSGKLLYIYITWAYIQNMSTRKCLLFRRAKNVVISLKIAKIGNVPSRIWFKYSYSFIHMKKNDIFDPFEYFSQIAYFIIPKNKYFFRVGIFCRKIKKRFLQKYLLFNHFVRCFIIRHVILLILVSIGKNLFIFLKVISPESLCIPMWSTLALSNSSCIVTGSLLFNYFESLYH